MGHFPYPKLAKREGEINKLIVFRLYMYVVYLYTIFIIYLVSYRDGRGSYFFHGAGRGGEGLGQKSMGRTGAGIPPFPTGGGGGGKGSKSAG